MKPPAVAIARPSGLTAEQLEALEAYCKRGGNALVIGIVVDGLVFASLVRRIRCNRVLLENRAA